MNDRTMYSITFSKSEAVHSSEQSLFTASELAEMQAWVNHLPIADEGIRTQIANTLQALCRSSVTPSLTNS